MKYYYNNKCLDCRKEITDQQITYSTKRVGVPLCYECLCWIIEKQKKTTNWTIRLYFELKKRNIPVELEKWDGHKHIDIAIIPAKLNIEVDGTHHNTNQIQALADLKRTCYSLKQGYITIRIPNTLTNDDNLLDETADMLAEIASYFIRANQNFRFKKY